jgi:hypothetical protein
VQSGKSVQCTQEENKKLEKLPFDLLISRKNQVEKKLEKRQVSRTNFCGKLIFYFNSNCEKLLLNFHDFFFRFDLIFSAIFRD